MSSSALVPANSFTGSSSTMQDPVVKANLLRAKQMNEEIKKCNLDKIKQLADEIYREALKCIQDEVSGKYNVRDYFTPVVYELNTVSTDPQVLQNLQVLTSVLKAQHAIAELTWVKCLIDKNRPVDLTDRDEFIRVAEKLRLSLLNPTKVVADRLFMAPAAARYEAACFKQAVQCLSPTEGVWKQFVGPTADAIGAATTHDIIGLIRALSKIGGLAKKEWISNWYLEMFDLEWKATNITTAAAFRKEVEPHVKKFTSEGKKYTLGLVKILTLIFNNENSEAEVKKIAVDELAKLVTKKAVYTVSEAIYHPDQITDKIANKPDRYADSRSYAAWALVSIAKKDSSHSKAAKDALTSWKDMVKDKSSKKYFVEKNEAEARAEYLKTQLADLEKKAKELEVQLQAVSIQKTRDKSTDNSEKLLQEEDRINLELLQLDSTEYDLETDLNACTIKIVQETELESKLAKALDKIEAEESDLIDQLLEGL